MATEPAPGEADVILRGAPVFRDGRWDGDCLAIRAGRIAAVGTMDQVTHLVSSRTEVREMRGQWLLPGFHDAHVHPVAAGMEMNQCDLTGLDEAGEYLARIAEYASTHPNSSWITGGGWSMDAFESGVPTADFLDGAVRDRPVYLPNRDHHSAWVNSRALELAGLDVDTPDPSDGRIERRPDGTPTGALHEGAMALVSALVPPPSPSDLMTGLLTAQAHLHSLGIVGWQDALVGKGLGMVDTLPTYLAAAADDALTAKVVLALWWDRERGLEQLPELLARRSLAGQAGLDASSVKIMQDGVCETHTASMLEPYRDAHGRLTDNHGLAFISADKLAQYVGALDAEDFQVHIHALGDRAVRDSLDAVGQAVAANGQRRNRHHLAHLQVIEPSDVPRFAELEVTPNAQPLWACRDETMEVLTLPFLSETAQQQQYVFGSLRRTGARLACGSDWPVSSADPIQGIHVAVNRRAPGEPLQVPPLLPAEALTVAEAIAGYTTGAAYVNRLEHSSGRLEVGLAADIVVLDSDILAVDPLDISSCRVTGTFVDGREVYAR